MKWIGAVVMRKNRGRLEWKKRRMYRIRGAN